MSMQETAAEAISLLREEGWNKGCAIGPDGSLCLATALAEGMLRTGVITEPAETRRLWQLALGHIRGLFPGRLDPNHQSVADFNDHPDTTQEDVLLILKHMTEGE